MKPTSARVIADLEALAALTTDAKGAQRVAWGPTWQAARAWFTEKLERELGITPERDGAGNLWATLPGASPRTHAATPLPSWLNAEKASAPRPSSGSIATASLQAPPQAKRRE